MDFEYWPPPGWDGWAYEDESVYARKQPPAIDWKLAAQFVKDGSSDGTLLTFDWWGAESRAWEAAMLGARNNGNRIVRMVRSKPGGISQDGRPWYVGILYAAPDDEEIGYTDLVGIVTRFGHVGCVYGRYGGGYRPYVEALTERGQHLIVPVLCGEEPGQEPSIMLPHYADLVSRVARFGGRH